MDKVIHFEVPADDTSRAKQFYHNCFGWESQDFPQWQYTVVRTVEVNENQEPKEAGAINGGIYKREPEMPHPQVFVNVVDINQALEKIVQHGGKVVREKMPVGEMGFVANFKDSEGNVMGLWQDNKPS